MEDHKIVALYFARSEQAIAETQKKYGRYCRAIAYGILHSEQDAEECENDTYLRAWNAIPPHKPSRLATFLGKITRHLALDCYDRAHANKRAHTDAVFEELEAFLPAGEASPADEIALKEAINGFLSSLAKRDRVIFMRRYWFMLPVRDIAHGMGLTESGVKSILLRTREKLKRYLEKEGIFL